MQVDDGAEADGGMKKNGEVGMESGREVLLRFGISCNLMLKLFKLTSYFDSGIDDVIMFSGCSIKFHIDLVSQAIPYHVISYHDILFVIAILSV